MDRLTIFEMRLYSIGISVEEIRIGIFDGDLASVFSVIGHTGH